MILSNNKSNNKIMLIILLFRERYIKEMHINRSHPQPQQLKINKA